MNTDARRKASAAYHARREAEGLKKVTLWLSPEARAKLDAMKAAAGSKDKAAELAIMAWRASTAVSAKLAPSAPGLRKPAKTSPPKTAAPFRGVTASGEALPKRGAYQKKGKT